jgi:hypothetical protein
LAGSHQADGDAEQDRDQQDLQDVAVGERPDQRVRDDRHQEAGDRRLVRLVRIVRDRGGIERGDVDVHAGAGLDHVGDDQPDDQRQRREEQEVCERLARDATDRAQFLHACDAGHQRQEDDGGDDHLDELDEPVAERLQRLAIGRVEMPERGAERDRDEDLEIELTAPLLAPGRLCDRIGLGRNHCIVS